MLRNAVFFLLAGIFTVAMGCSRSELAAPEKRKAVSEEVANAFAGTLQASLRQCDVSALSSQFDLEWMMREAVVKSGIPSKEQKAAFRELKTQIPMVRGEFCEFGKNGSTIAFLRSNRRPKGSTVLFRIARERALNYIEFYVGEDSQHSIAAFDMYQHQLGEDLSQTIAKTIRGLYDLPVEASQAPTDLQLYQEFLETEQTEKAVDALARLSKELGGDAALRKVQIGLLLDAGILLKRATELAEEAVQENPDDKECYFLLMESHVATRNHAGSVALMRLMGERFEMVFQEEGIDASDPNYAALLASPEWAAYVANLAPQEGALPAQQ